MRKIILHYHLFKNAGTSVDRILKDSFGDQWLNWDKPSGEGGILPSDMADFICKNPQLKAISSHDVVPPLPIGDFEIFPLVFIRHPIIRARSAYLFLWQKELGLDQPKGSFADYIDKNLPAKGNSGISNFQAAKLSNIVYGKDVVRKPLRDYEILDRSKLFLDSIPYFGLVDHFQHSLVRMHYYLKPNFSEIKITNHQTNVTQNISDKLEHKLEAIKLEIGDEKYQILCDRNALDLKLYRYAVASFFSIAKPAK